MMPLRHLLQREELQSAKGFDFMRCRYGKMGVRKGGLQRMGVVGTIVIRNWVNRSSLMTPSLGVENRSQMMPLRHLLQREELQSAKGFDFMRCRYGKREELQSAKGFDFMRCRTGKASTSTDVFAFGAFMLEVACGQRPLKVQGLIDDMSLVRWVLEKWKEGAILDATDPRLEGDFVVEEIKLVLKLGLLCSHYNPMTRPSMRQVRQYLDGEVILPEVFMDIEGAGMTALFGNEVSNAFAMTLPSSCVSANAMSTESLLNVGR
ncbi:unnamed protein product [Ilex paraguariensis]|uniref:Uncharacterized protein n=1 Tax=Ilex paraguariensis TaxID=185542 RepID=A0ABC8SCP8_9AQUA